MTYYIANHFTWLLTSVDTYRIDFAVLEGTMPNCKQPAIKRAFMVTFEGELALG